MLEVISYHSTDESGSEAKKAKKSGPSFDLLMPRDCVCIHKMKVGAQRMPEPPALEEYRNDWPFAQFGCENCDTFCFGDLVDFLTFRRDCEGFFRMLQSFDQCDYQSSTTTISRLICYSARQHDLTYYPSNLRFEDFDTWLEVTGFLF